MSALRFTVFGSVWLWCGLLPSLGANPSPAAPLRFQVTVKAGLAAQPKAGRLFVIISRTNNPEPHFALGQAGPKAPVALARDLKDLTPDSLVVLDASGFVFPITNLTRLEPGEYFVQALFDSNTDLRSANAPGNLYSSTQRIRLDPARSGDVKLELGEAVPAEEVPPDSDRLKFIKIQSPLLSKFHGRPICLRAGVVLPRDYDREPLRRYPLWVRIGGLNARYTGVSKLMAPDSEFSKTWLADPTPRVILLQLDGAGPDGDPYQVDSANNGPYGEALLHELIPQIESRFRAIGEPRGRFLSGISTGGWVALALQIFYPDAFNGAWAFCPDPVDFRALELIDIYEDDNAYNDRQGNEQPSARDLKGHVTLTMRREVGAENLLGPGNSYTLSGEQWGAWNATFSPRGKDGLPMPLFDPHTGKLDRAVAEQWKKYDLRLVLERNWPVLAPKLRGKLHIAAGEADGYFLNNAVHLLDESLAHAHPAFEGRIVYGPGKGHGWMDVTLREMLEAMQERAKRVRSR